MLSDAAVGRKGRIRGAGIALRALLRRAKYSMAAFRRIRVPLSATDDELLLLVRFELQRLVVEDYEGFYRRCGYAMAWGKGADGIRQDIQQYRSQEFFPGVTKFRVTDWQTALGGNPRPSVLIRRYLYSETLPIVVTIELHLALNGRWSNLGAHFVITVLGPDATEGFLTLEDIVSDAWDGRM